MAKLHDRDEVVLGGSDGPFRRESAMVKRGGILKGMGDRRSEVSGEVGRSFVVQ
jgi:hypothetical protein